MVFGINNSNINNGLIEQKTSVVKNRLSVNISEKSTFNNDVLFVGLNPNAKFEAQDLAKTPFGKVKFIGNNSTQEIKINGRKLDILDYKQVTDFCMALKLDTKTTDKLRKVFSSVVSEDNTIQIGTKENLKNKLAETGVAKDLQDKLYNELSQIGSSFKNEKTSITYNLTFKNEVNNFVDSLDLSKDQTDKLKILMLDSSQNIRDELAGIISTFAKAEHGESIPSRFLISGHSMGVDYFGEKNGSLKSATVQEIAKIMPKAAGQIEDLVVAACYAGSKRNLEKYKEVFPNLKTFMGYVDSAPGSYSGATPHLRTWEKASRDGNEDISSGLFKNTRKGDHVATWSNKVGYSVDPVIEKEMNARQDFVDIINYIVPVYPKYVNDDQPVTDPSNCDLREAYSQIQRVLGSPNNTFLPEQKQWLVDMKNMFIRILYYPQVAEKFDNAYKDEINKGYLTLGIKAPDFGKLSRAQTRAEITNLQKMYDEKKDMPNFKDKANLVKETLDLLNDGLINLSSDKIPDNWV